MKISKHKLLFLTAMVIFGTIGLFRRNVALPSSVIALVRGIVGTLFLLLIGRIMKGKKSDSNLKKILPKLAVSGAAIGFNWILLFESYCYTSIATATLCYYMAPILVILAATVLFREKITRIQGVCVAAAFIGMIFVCGIFDSREPIALRGILLGLSAAVLYAFVILMNKNISGIDPLTKTSMQLLFASAALLPYVLLTVDFSLLTLDVQSVILLFIMGAVHTGLAYFLYFASMGFMEAKSIALMSYIDPVVAILLSALLLGESLTVFGAIGAVIVLASAYFSENAAG